MKIRTPKTSNLFTNLKSSLLKKSYSFMGDLDRFSGLFEYCFYSLSIAETQYKIPERVKPCLLPWATFKLTWFSCCCDYTLLTSVSWEKKNWGSVLLSCDGRLTATSTVNGTYSRPENCLLS